MSRRVPVSRAKPKAVTVKESYPKMNAPLPLTCAIDCSNVLSSNPTFCFTSIIVRKRENRVMCEKTEDREIELCVCVREREREREKAGSGADL